MDSQASKNFFLLLRKLFFGKQNLDKPFKEDVKSLLIFVIVLFSFTIFVAQPFIIPSGSMKPGLLIGDIIIVSKYDFGYSKYNIPFNLPLIKGRIFESNQPKIGEVVVFKGPLGANISYVKRVVGLPGDRIIMKEGILHINDHPAIIDGKTIFADDLWFDRTVEPKKHMRNEARKIRSYTENLPNQISHSILKLYDFGAHGSADNSHEYVVPAGYYFMMGDNRDESGDSRFLKPIGLVPANYIVGKARWIIFSTKARWWEVWRWLIDIRFNRILKAIK